MGTEGAERIDTREASVVSHRVRRQALRGRPGHNGLWRQNTIRNRADRMAMEMYKHRD